MIPSFAGRIQTRVVLLATVGVVWTLIVGPFLPAGGAPLGDVYAMAFRALVIVTVLGVLVWEPLYHLLQQYRWEKDWPTLFGLLTGINEGIVTYWAMRATGGMDAVPVSAFVWHFSTTWMAVWAVAGGPMRVVLLRWRFRGGRILG